MNITSDMIKQLREKTGAGMMDCKRALESSGGNMDAAVEYLRKKGAAVSQKRADRSAREGVIVARVAPDGMSGVVVEVNCETDFVGRSEDFVRFAETVAETIQAHRPSSLGDVHGLRTSSGRLVSEMLNDVLAKVGEKIDIRRFTLFDSTDGAVTSYTHLGSKIGVLIELSGIPPGEASTGVGRDLAMQVAAMNPMVISRDQLDRSVIERELEIYRTQAKNEGKPAQVIDRIASGKLDKFYQEVCLLEQTFIKDSGKTVQQVVNEVGSSLGRSIAVRRFKRYHLGEEIVA